MKTYRSTRPTAEKTKKRLSKRGKQTIAISASIVVVAVALTLSLTFGLRPNNTPADEGVQTVVPPVQTLTFSTPLGSCVVTKGAALNRLVYNDTLKQWRTHNGVDFEATAGSDVMTIAPGTVVDVENTILDGIVITVAHDEGYTSVYKGLGTAAVAKDEKIEAGAVIGTVGTMMCEQNSGAHLHLEMKKNGKYVAVTDYIDVETDK